MAGDVGEDLRGFGDEGAVDVDDAGSEAGEYGGDAAEDFEAADAADGCVVRGEEVADVGLGGGAEEGVGDGMAEDVGVGVAGEADGVRDGRRRRGCRGGLRRRHGRRSRFRCWSWGERGVKGMEKGMEEWTSAGSEPLFEGEFAVAGADEHFAVAGVRVAGWAEQDGAAGGFDKEVAGGDVPEADLLLDVGVEPAGGDVGHGEGGAAHEAGFADFVGDFAVAFESLVEGCFAFRKSDGDDGIGEGIAGTDADGAAVEGWDAAAEDGPGFVEHGVVDHSEDGFAVVAEGDGDAEVRDAVEEIDGAVDGVDDPLPRGGLVAGGAFLAEDDVVRASGEDSGFEEDLGFAVEGEFDVVGEFFIDLKIAAEGFFQGDAGRAGGGIGELEEGGEGFRC